MAILTSKGARAPHQLKGRRNVRISHDRRGSGDESAKIEEMIGDLTLLETSEKTNLVGSINEVVDNVNEVAKITSWSTEEKRIGTWTDEKPLYQKSFFYDSFHTEGWNDAADISSLNIDSLGSLDANAHVSIGGGGWYKAPFVYRDNPALGFDIRLTGPDGTNQKSILQVLKKGTSLDTISITIRYTKTTD